MTSPLCTSVRTRPCTPPSRPDATGSGSRSEPRPPAGNDEGAPPGCPGERLRLVAVGEGSVLDGGGRLVEEAVGLVLHTRRLCLQSRLELREVVTAEEQFAPGEQRDAYVGLSATPVASIKSAQWVRGQGRRHSASFFVSLRLVQVPTTELSSCTGPTS